MAWQNVGADSSTARLLKAAQAALLAEDLPAASGKTLVALCRAVRLYLEAWDQTIALDRLDRIDQMVDTMEDDAHLRAAFKRHTAEVRRHLSHEIKREEKRDAGSTASG